MNPITAIVAFALFAAIGGDWLATRNARAQQQPTGPAEYVLKLKTADVNVIATALGEIPKRIADDVLSRIAPQVAEQNAKWAEENKPKDATPR